jgi:hypothetical protein
MRDLVYISKHLDSIKMDLIIEEDKHSIWTYLLDPINGNKIILDGFICSTGTIVENTSDVKRYIDQDFSPPISQDYSNEFSIQRDLTEMDFRIETTNNGVSIFIKDSCFVILDLIGMNSYSKSVSKPGPFGSPIEIMDV